MRYFTCVFMMLLGPAMALANSQPTTAPDARSRIGALVGTLFSQPRTAQQQIRDALVEHPDLPTMLADLLADDDHDIRRTSLLLLRDDYGDWPVVAAVQTMLQSELARGQAGDAHIIAACCEVLADWPRWDSIPVLLSAMRSDHQVAASPAPDSPAERVVVAVWRQADAALRLISGEWPMPEPDASAEPVAPGSPRDSADREELSRSWGEWWAMCLADNQPLPQVRMELVWSSPLPGRPGTYSTEFQVALALLWVRPNGNIYYRRAVGLCDDPTLPMWRWQESVTRRCQGQSNAIQADAARALAGEVAAAPGGTVWGISRPAGLPAGWHGRLQIISPFGHVATVELADIGAPGAVRPPEAAIEAVSELLAIPMP